jgi:hypothetical protein
MTNEAEIARLRRENELLRKQVAVLNAAYRETVAQNAKFCDRIQDHLAAIARTARR